MTSYREGNESPLLKEHHEVMESLVMDVTRLGMVSEMLLLSLLMFRKTTSVLVNEQCNGAQEHDPKERWRSGGPLWEESGTSSLEEAKEVTPLGSLKRDLLHL